MGIGLLLENFNPAEGRGPGGKWIAGIGKSVHVASDLQYYGKGTITGQEADTGHWHVKLDDGRTGRVAKDQVFRTRKEAVDKVYARRNHSTREPGSVMKGRSLTVESNQSGVLAARDDVSGQLHVYSKPALEALTTKPPKVQESEPASVGLLLEHFNDPLLQPKPPRPKPAASKPKQKHAHLQGLTDAALRARLRPDSGSTASERETAAALLQRRRDASAKHAEKQAARQGAPASSSDAKASAGEKAEASSSDAPAQESIGLMLEAFAAAAPKMGPSAPAPNSAAAQPMNVGSWDPSKHPRAMGGKFGVTTGGKRAARSPTASTSTLGVGSKGTLVKSLQQQLGVSPSGTYDQQTRTAVANYQRQHGLQVDGVVGRQTLASMRGNHNAASIAPGAITAAQARITTVRTTANAGTAGLGGVIV